MLCDSERLELNSREKSLSEFSHGINFLMVRHISSYFEPALELGSILSKYLED